MSTSVLVLAFDTGPKQHGWALVDVTAERAGLRDCGLLLTSALPMTNIVAYTVAIECPQHAYSAATASPIIATSRAAGELGGVYRSRGYRVEYITAADWRAGLLGAANAHDRAVKEWVERNVQGLPKKTNVHVRDAIALAVFAGRRALRGEVML